MTSEMEASEKRQRNDQEQNARVQCFPVPIDLRGCHPLISQTKRIVEKEKPDERSLLRSTQKGILNVTVTRGSLHRALRIMQAIITAAESRGWSVKPKSEEAGCAIKIGDDELGITISERVSRFEIPPEKPTEGWYWKRYRYEPTGVLTLDITDYVATARRHAWSDGKRRKLEEMLPEFIDGLVAAAEARRRWKLELEERDRRWKQEQLEQERLEERIKAERRRRDELFLHLEWYDRSVARKNLIATFRQHELPRAWSEEARNRWVDWAGKMADMLNPFHNFS
jgi:hypothetical protein